MASNTSHNKHNKSWSQLVSHKSDQIQTNQQILDPKETIDMNAIHVNEETFVSLNDVMSEQLAIELNEDFGHHLDESKANANSIANQRSANADKQSNSSIDNTLISESDLHFHQISRMLNNEDNQYMDCSCDELLANLLQKEFDRQHDHNLKKEEQKQNANSKVSISYDRFRRLQEEVIESDSDDDYHEYGEESKHWDSFEKSKRQELKIGRQGFAKDKNGVVTTKHDLDTSARRNACKVMELDSHLRTGDGGGFDMKLNNNVYNALKVHSIHEGKRMARLHEKKEKSTAEKVLDEKSRILVFKLINRGILDTVNGVISTGKESVVLHGRGSNPDKGITSCEVAIKIFKTTLNEFKNRSQYICNDPILQQTSKLSKQNPKFMIPLWAEKEMHNLYRIRRNGVLCPEVLLLKKHILVMTFIGSDGKPAPTLKDAKLSEEQLSKAWKQTVEMMIRLFRDCDLIHADLSEYNLLWHENKVWCIDVSQSVLTTHPMAYKFLWRDCINIHNYFSKRCLPEVLSARDLFSKVCCKQLNSDSIQNDSNFVDLLDKIENYERNEQLLTHGITDSNDPFEDMLEKSIREKEQQLEPSLSTKDCSAKSPKVKSPHNTSNTTAL